MRAPLLALLCAGCAVGPDFHRPAAPTTKDYTSAPATKTASADGKEQHFGGGEKLESDWWRVLHCRALDEVVHRALVANPGIAAARATLRENQDLLRAGYGVFFPQVTAQAGATRQEYNPAPGTPLPASTFSLYTVSGSVSYALDIWGGERRQVEALAAGVDAERFTLAGAYVMLASNVASAMIAQAGYRAQISATEASAAALKEQIRIAEAQVRAGTVPLSNVLTLESQLASTEATIPPLEEKIDQAADLLAALTGESPSAYHDPVIALTDLELPEHLPLSLPSELVRQRPDILIAEAELHAANATIGVATAAMLPSLTLTAGVGSNATSAGDLFGPNSPFWSVGAGLTQPIFRGGTLNYQRKAAIEARDAAFALYRQTVLSAFQQVADTLRALVHDADALSAQLLAVETADHALRLVQANYQAGVATYLQVLVVDQQYLAARVGYVQAVAQRIEDTVALYVALGGGWWTDPNASRG